MLKKILKIVVDVLEYVIPVLVKIKKDKIAKELEIVATGVELFSNKEDKDPEQKGKVLKKLIDGLAEKAGIKTRLRKKIKKFEKNLWGKIF